MADAQGNSYGPYDIEVAGSEAEPFTEDAYYDLFGHVTGVVSGGALTFTGLTATLAPIVVRAHGSRLARTDPWSVASAPTTGSSPRRDMLVARRKRTSGEGVSAVPGKTFLTLLQGEAAATPADPTPDSDDDEPLWSWQVPGGGGTVVTGIRDLRRSGRESPLLIATMADRPTIDRYLGLQVKPRDMPSLTFAWTGSYWWQEGLPVPAGASAPPAGSYGYEQSGTAVVTTGSGNGGGVQVILPTAYSAPPLKVDLAPGDNASSFGFIVPVNTNHQANSVYGAARNTAGGTMEGALIRVNYRAVGYNT